MTQGTSENQEKHFESSTAAEQGGVSSESSKKPFFTRNVIIAIVGVIVALLVGGMILVHVASKAGELSAIPDNSTKSSGISPKVTISNVVKDETNDGKSLTSVNISGPDRIFFIAQTRDENGMFVEEIQSILADNSQLLSHGKFKDNEIYPFLSSNNEAKSVAYTFLIDDQPRIVLQDWNSETKRIFDISGMTPSFSANGTRIVFVNNSNDLIQFSVACKNGNVLKNVNLTKDFARAGIPLFSHDGNSLLFLNADDNYSMALHKINIEENEKVDLICDMNGMNMTFLVSPLSDKIIRVHQKTLNNPISKFSLVDFNDMNVIHVIEIEVETKENETFDLISWSPSGKCVYMYKKIRNCSYSIVELDLESKEISEIYKIPNVGNTAQSL